MQSGTSGLLTEEEMIDRLKRQPAETAPVGSAGRPAPPGGYRPAAVLVPLLRQEGGWSLLFTRRTETVNSHKGQVSFPGGAADEQDASPQVTALREAEEEIGLRPQDVRILGSLSSRMTVTSFLVTPVIARIPWPYSLRISPEEVSRVFTIPLEWLAEEAHREARPYTLPSGYVENVIFFEPYDGELLWGASARITLDLMRVFGLI